MLKLNLPHNESPATDLSQCDQMARLFVQYWALENIENLPKSQNISQIVFKILLITQRTLKMLPKMRQILAKLAKFRPIWSHCHLCSNTRADERNRKLGKLTSCTQDRANTIAELILQL